MPNTKMQNTKLINALVSVAPKYANDKVDGQAIALTTCSKDKAGTTDHTRVIALLDYDALLPEIECTDKLSGLDRAIMDAVYTRWANRTNQESNECMISYLDIYRTMHGCNASQIGPSVEDKIRRSVRKLRHIDVTIQYNEDSNRVRDYFKKAGIRSAAIRGHALVADEIDIEMRNHTAMKGIRLYRCPVMWEYALAQQQILTVEPELLDIKGMSMTDKVTAIRNCLIAIIKSKAAKSLQSDRFRYETILNNAGYPLSPYRQTQSTDRKMINSILKYYASIGIIVSYTESKDHKTVTINM